MVHYFCFLSGVSGSECTSILVMQNLNAAILCSIEWLEKKLVVVSLLVGPHLKTARLLRSAPRAHKIHKTK